MTESPVSTQHTNVKGTKHTTQTLFLRDYGRIFAFPPFFLNRPFM